MNVSLFRKSIFVLTLIIVVTVFFFFSHIAEASVRQAEEADGTILYKSFNQLQDSQQQSWQVVVFQREQENKNQGKLKLRLVGFPGQVEIAHPEPLILETNRSVWQAEDLFAKDSPASNVGQYNLGDIIDQLSKDNNLLLKIPEVNGDDITLNVPGVMVLEWKIVAGNNES